MPRFGVIEDDNPNAFTFGHYPGEARPVGTRGNLSMLCPQEQRAILAHERGHIARGDFVVITVAGVAARADD